MWSASRSFRFLVMCCGGEVGTVSVWGWPLLRPAVRKVPRPPQCCVCDRHAVQALMGHCPCVSLSCLSEPSCICFSLTSSLWFHIFAIWEDSFISGPVCFECRLYQSCEQLLCPVDCSEFPWPAAAQTGPHHEFCLCDVDSNVDTFGLLELGVK